MNYASRTGSVAPVFGPFSSVLARTGGPLRTLPFEVQASFAEGITVSLTGGTYSQKDGARSPVLLVRR
jgi:hypothetical protein